MARQGSDSTQQDPKNYQVNIAGDYAPRGLDVEPNEPYISRGDIRPTGSGGVQFEDEVSSRDRQRDDATRESLKSATGPSTLGQEAGKQLVNPASQGVNADWPVDE